MRTRTVSARKLTNCVALYHPLWWRAVYGEHDDIIDRSLEPCGTSLFRGQVGSLTTLNTDPFSTSASQPRRRLHRQLLWMRPHVVHLFLPDANL